MIVGGENRTWIFEGGMTGAGLCPYCWAWFPTLSSLMTHKRDDHPIPEIGGAMLTWEAVVHNLTTDEYATYTVEARECFGAEGEALRQAAKRWPTDDGSAAPLEVHTLRLIGEFIPLKGGTLDAGGLTRDQAKRIKEEFRGD